MYNVYVHICVVECARIFVYKCVLHCMYTFTLIDLLIHIWFENQDSSCQYRMP